MARSLIAELSGGHGDGVGRVRFFEVFDDAKGDVTGVHVEVDGDVSGRVIATIRRPNGQTIERVLDLTGTAVDQAVSLSGAWRWNQLTGERPYTVNLAWMHPDRVAGVI